MAEQNEYLLETEEDTQKGKYLTFSLADVDSISEVITIPVQDMEEPPQMNQGINNRCIKNIGKAGGKIKLLPDCEMLLNDGEPADIVQHSGESPAARI